MVGHIFISVFFANLMIQLFSLAYRASDSSTSEIIKYLNNDRNSEELSRAM